MYKLTNPLTRLLLAGAAALPLLTGLAPQAHADIRSGLKAYWNFDKSDFTDASGNFFDGTESGTLPIEFVDGKSGFGKAVVLNGEDQEITITGGEPDDLAFAGGSMTISAWLRVDSFDTEWQALIAKGENNNWRVARHSNDGGIAIAGGLGDTPNSAIVNDGVWHHMVAIVDREGTTLGSPGTAIYIDGAKSATTTGTPALTANGKRVQIGENPDATGREWQGELDDIAIWDRPLTEDEISSLYNGGEGKTLNSLFVTQIEILGVGAGSLLGGDLTDPENDGDEVAGENDPSWNWVGITASHEPKFGSPEAAFNIFDNKVGGGDDKWCCDDPKDGAPVWVAVQFANPVSLTHFTVTSGNDTPGRDPTDWAIQGSNDGATYTDIYHMTPETDPVVPWTERNQVVKFTLPAPAAAYRYIRYIAYVTPADLHQLNELELFGNVGSSEAAFFSSVRNNVTTFAFRVNDAGTAVVDPATVKLVLDGAEVALGALTKVDGKIDASYTPATQFRPNSHHTYVITAKDNFNNTITAEGEFTTQSYALLTAADSVTPNTEMTGFIWNVHQNNSFTANDNIRPEQQLAGLLGINFANPEAQSIALAPGIPGATDKDPIMFEIAGTLSLGQSAGQNGAFPDDVMPGIPGTGAGPTDGIAAEILYFVELPAGPTRMIVNSDDGFRTTAGAVTDVFKAQLAGEFSGGRGAADTEFTVYAETAGVYAFRTIWEEGGGGANIELVTIKEDGTKVLVNDVDNGGLRAYRALVPGGGKTAVTRVTPLPNATGVFFDTVLNATIVDGSDAVDAASVKLTLDGNAAAATATKNGGTTTIEFQPSPSLSAGVHTASLTFKAGANTRTETWSFTVAPYVTLTAAHQAVSVDKTKSGFNWDVFENGSFTHTSLVQTEQALAGTLSATAGGDPLPNLADPAKPSIATGEGVVGKNGLIHFEIAGVLNLSQTAGDNNGNFGTDDQMPGIPGTDNSNNGIDAEIITFVELPAGGVTLGVNSDDGFRTQVGYINVPADGLTLGQFDGGRGASDTLFRFLVKDAGIYPLRTIWNEGGGGANIEIFSVKADGSKVLLNDVANGGFATYRVGVAPNKPSATPSISVVRNANGTITVTWEGDLEVADKAAGPYVKLVGAVSPLTLTPNQAAQFARARK